MQWRLRGSIAVFPVDIDFESEVELDLITGRVVSHTDRWDLSRWVSATGMESLTAPHGGLSSTRQQNWCRLSPSARLAFTVSRAAWSITVRGGNAKDDGSQLVKQIKSRFSADDEGQVERIPGNTTSHSRLIASTS